LSCSFLRLTNEREIYSAYLSSEQPSLSCCDTAVAEIPDWVPIRDRVLISTQFCRHRIFDSGGHVAGAVVAWDDGLIVGYGDRFGGGRYQNCWLVGGLVWFVRRCAVSFMDFDCRFCPLAFFGRRRKARRFRLWLPRFLLRSAFHAFVARLARRIAFVGERGSRMT